MQGRPTLCVRRPKNTTSIGIPSRPYRLRNARNKPIAHVLSVVARSNRLLGLLKRTFGSHSKALFTGYRSMIRPILEYACQAWNPHQAYLIEKLECVQRNVTRWIIGKGTPYEDRLKSLKLATLVQRREFLSLIQLFKFIKGHCSVNTNSNISFSNRQ